MEMDFRMTKDINKCIGCLIYFNEMYAIPLPKVKCGPNITCSQIWVRKTKYNTFVVKESNQGYVHISDDNKNAYRLQNIE